MSQHDDRDPPPECGGCELSLDRRRFLQGIGFASLAVLAGLVNKQLVASLEALGVRAIGLTGADGGLLRCRIADPAHL